jgi:hypothetical protein
MVVFGSFAHRIFSALAIAGPSRGASPTVPGKPFQRTSHSGSMPGKTRSAAGLWVNTRENRLGRPNFTSHNSGQSQDGADKTTTLPPRLAKSQSADAFFLSSSVRWAAFQMTTTCLPGASSPTFF